MRRTLMLLSTMVVALLLAGGVALAAPFTNSSPIQIVDDGPANPYPSQINVQNLSGNITDVDLKLSGYSHVFPDDVGVLVVGPQGQKVLVMSDVGFTCDVSGIDLTFDDEATSSLPNGCQITAGTYKPTQGTAQDGEGSQIDANFPSPAPAGPYGTQLSVFDGTVPNGTWSLYVFDDTDVETGQIANGWSLEITTADDTTAPTVSSIERVSSNPTNTTGNVDWTVTFSENVTGVDTGDFALANNGLGGSPAISSVTQGANASVYTVTASTGAGSGTLGLNLNDNDSIADAAGNKLGGTGTGTAGGSGTGNGSFTGEVYTIDRTAPTVTATAVKGPDFTDTYTADTWTNKDVRVTFTCADTGGSGLTAGSADQVKTFTAETSGTTASFDGTCADNAGNTAAASNFGPIKIDKSAPNVTSTFPGNGREVGPAANVTATFSDEMLPASVMNAFKLFKKGSTNQIAAQVSYDAATDIATLNPTNNLKRGATYKAVVTTVAKDKAGNRLDQDDSTDGLQQKVWFFEID
jgi:hypothetical protein